MATQIHAPLDAPILTQRPRAWRRAIASFLPRDRFSILLALTAAAALVLLAIVKITSSPSIRIDPLLAIYTAFVTIFQLSRVALAMRFSRTDRSGIAALIASGAEKVYLPHVTFIIPCMNEEKAIERTIRKCFEADYPADRLEVIVINDGSTDGTADVLHRINDRYKNLIIVDWKENRGKRHAMYEGFKRAKGEIVVQLDSDSYIVPDSFYGLIAPFCDPTVGAVCAHAEPENADKNVITKMQAAFYFMSFRILKAAESTTSTVFCCSGCSSAYRKSAVLPILDSWVSEKFLGRPVTWGDDRSLTSWMLREGHRTVYTDAAMAYTIVPESWSKLLKQQLRWKKGWVINSIITSRFIFRSHPFVSLLYYFPLVLISFVTPIMAVRAFIYGPIVNGTFPLLYASGVILLTVVLVTYYRAAGPNNKYWPYLFLWSIFNMFVLSFLMFYAILRLQDRKWATR